MPIAKKYLKVLRNMSKEYCDVSKYGEAGRIDDTIQGVKTCKKSRGVFYAKMKKEGIDYRRQLNIELEEGPSPDVEAIKPKVIAKEKVPGLILTAPHGELIAKGAKKGVVKPRKLEKHIDEIVHIIQGDFSYGTMRLKDEGEKINTLKEFEMLDKIHRITPEERKKWCRQYKSWCKFPLYMYRVELIKVYPKPVPIKRPRGAQVWIEAVKLIPKLSLEELLVYHAEIHSNPPDCLCSDEHTNTVNELLDRGYSHIVVTYNIQDRIYELIKDWRTYNPSKVEDEVLRDDWRIVNAWWKTLLSKGRKMKSKQFIDYSLEEQRKIVKKLIEGIKKEMIARGWSPRSLAFELPVNMQIDDIDAPYVKTLDDKTLVDLWNWLDSKARQAGKVTETLYNAGTFVGIELRKRGLWEENRDNTIGKAVKFPVEEYPPPGLSDKISLELVLETFRRAGIIPIKGQPYGSYLTGRVVNLGEVPRDHDIDVLFRQEYDPRVVIALRKLKPEWLARMIHPVFDVEGPYIGHSIPLHGYALNPLPKELMIKGYGPFRKSLAREVKIGRAIIGVKPASGFGKQEFWDVKEAWSAWGADNINVGLYIEEKIDGRRFQLHYDKARNIVKIITEDRMRDRADAFPELVEEIKKLPVKSVILDGEIVVYSLPSKIRAVNARARREAGELIPREDTASLTVGKVSDETRANLVYVFYDIMYLDGKQLTDLPYKERRAIYTRIIPKKARYLDVARGEEAKNMRDFFRLVWKYRSIKGSEGIVAKRSDFKYPIKYTGENRTREMMKIKNLKEIDVKVLGITQKKTKAGKPLPTWMYESYFEIPKAEAAKWYPEDLKEHEGKIYARIGMAYGTGKKAKIGDIITVMPIRIREYEKKGKRRVTWMFPYFKEVRTDKKEADTLTTVERLIKLRTGPAPAQRTLRSLSDVEFQEWLEAPREKTIYVELDDCPYWNYMDACPFRSRFYTTRTPQYLTIYKMEQLRFPVNCPLAYHFKCHWIKDYYYTIKVIRR